jgi:RND superfamily putative drug exporter
VFERLGSWTYRFRFLIVIAWVIAGVFMGVFAPSLAGSGSTDQTSFLPAGSPSKEAQQAIERAFPGSTSASSATITLHRAGGLTAEDKAFRDEFAAWTTSPDAPEDLRAAVTETETADSRPELEELLRSEDRSFEILVINLDVADAGDEATAVVEQLREHLVATTPQGLETHVTGAAAISSDYLEAVKVGTDSTTMVTVVLVVIVLLAIYRAPLAALIPLITIGGAFVVSTGILGFLAAAGWQVSSTLATFLVVMVFGVGTDYAIFLISRYREEVSGGGDWHDAARTTVRRIGAVITASAGTVIVGMLAMGVGDFKMIASMGPGIAIAVAVTLVAGLTLAPALLSIFGHYLFWPLHTRERHEGEPRGFFASLASAVSHRPAVVTVALLVLLIVPILYVPQARTNFDVMTDLPADSDSRLGYEAIAEHLGEDKLVQSTALIDAGGGRDMLAPAQMAKLHDLLVSLHETGGIATTTSLITPDGDTTIPDGFRPSATLREMADGFEGDDSADTSDNAGLLDDDVRDGLNQSLDYVNGVGVAFPDVAAGTAFREAQDGLEHALRIVDRVRDQSVLSTQLRTLSSSITSPANAAGGSDDDSTLMSDYLEELGAAFPEVRTLDAYKDGVRAARSLEQSASIDSALALSKAFDRLADHFDDQPDARLSPESLAGTSSAKQLKAEAEQTFGDLPDQLAALSSVFATRPDDIWIPTTLTGDDAQKLRDAVDAFVSKDGTATRFYLTSSSDPYSGGAFAIVKQAREIVADAAPAFGPAASGHIGGATAQFADVQDTLARDFQKVGLITVLGILIVLIVLLRAVVAPLYLVATVLISYGSTIGISAFLFQEVLGQPGISPYLPLMVFVLLVALGSDYNIFLMHRVREEAETRPMRDAVRVASGHTGAVITSAGLILAGTFGSMATASLMILFQVGIAVAIGVLIDTFLVRSILVPAITTLVGDWAWWPSGRVGRTATEPAAGRGAPVPVPAGAAAAAAVPAAAVATDATDASTPRSRRRLAIAIGLVVLIPVLVGGLLTWSFGSASGNLASIDAAVVNLDEGGSVPGVDGSSQLVSLGNDIAEALTAGDAGGFTWVTADQAAAETGLANGDYAAVLTIPADFSRTVAAIRTDTTGTAPKATLHVATDDSSGYTLGTVARAVTAAIGTTTGQDVTASYVDDVLVRMTTAHDALANAATSADSLATDGRSLADNVRGAGVVADTVSAGLRQLADGASSAADGTTQLVTGTRQLATGAGTLADGATQLATGTRGAADGATTLANGADQLADGLGTLASNTKDLPDQVDQLASGAKGVATGAQGVATGAQQLADGLDQMAAQTNGLGDSAAALNDGAAATESGARDVRDMADAAASSASSLAGDASALAGDVDGYVSGIDAVVADCLTLGGTTELCDQLGAAAAGGSGLVADANAVSSAAAGIASDTAGVAAGMDGVVSGADGVHDGTHALAESLPALETGIDQSASGANDLADGAGQVASGAQQVAGGTQQLADGMPALAGGIAQAADGGSSLADGAATLASGIGRLADGTAALAGGARQTAAGADRLADGTAAAAGGIGQLTDAMNAAADGAALVEAQVNGLADDGDSLADKVKDLASGLGTSADGLSTYDQQTRDRIGDLAADPVAVDATRVNGVTGAESGYAPDFMAIAAWLGALGAFLVIPAVWRRGDDRRWWLAVLRSFGAASAIAGIGTVLMVIVLYLLLGVSVANPGALLLFAVLAALAFSAVVQALVVLFGTRGWLAALLLLVLGIAASGIGMDAAAVPGPLAAIRPLLPLTAAIDAFRVAVVGGGGSLAVDGIVLLGWLVAGLLVSLAAAASADRRVDEDAEPVAA